MATYQARLGAMTMPIGTASSKATASSRTAASVLMPSAMPRSEFLVALIIRFTARRDGLCGRAAAARVAAQDRADYSAPRCSERSAARLAHQSGRLGVPSSNLGAPTTQAIEYQQVLDFFPLDPLCIDRPNRRRLDTSIYLVSLGVDPTFAPATFNPHLLLPPTGSGDEFSSLPGPPQATRCISLDHFVGAGNHCSRYGDAERLCSLKIARQLESRGQLHRQIRRIGALQDAIHVVCGSTKQIRIIHPVRNQTTRRDHITVGVDRRNAVTRGRRYDDIENASPCRKNVHQYDHSGILPGAQLCEGALDVAGCANRSGRRIYSRGSRGGFERLQEIVEERRGLRIEQKRGTAEMRHDFLQQLDPLAAQRRFDIYESGSIAARAWKAVDEAAADGVGDHNEDDRNCFRFALQRFDDRGGRANDQIGLKSNKLFRKRRHAFQIGGGPAVIDRNVAADVPAEVLQRFGEFGQARLRLRIALGVSHQHADPAHTAGLLRARGERPGRRAADKRDELPPLHLKPRRSRRLCRSPKKNVSIIPLPLTSMLPRASKSNRSSNKARVAAEIWTRPGTEWDSMRLAVLTVSPQTS